MKIAKHLKSGRFLPKSRKGVALLTVLTVMSLTTILVLTFFSLATSEHRSSNTYSHGVQAQQVGEQAVNMVIAQIREATTAGRTLAWASQPGAIRRWDDKGREEFAFKLYSDEEMKTLNWGSFEDDFVGAKTWSNRESHYVDLNEPVIRGEKVYYPIVHPLASTEPKWPAPLGGDTGGVEGFSYNENPDATLTNVGDFGGKAAKIAKAEGHVAMPVKWLYQLADGTIGVLSDSPAGGSQESYGFQPISGGGNPSEDNPLVARFAFWADDETSKLNINTHAGGLAWDVPKAGGALDMAMGQYQPAQKEWQRYPGHPASVHLGPALAPGILDIVNNADAMEMLYNVVPRVVGGGSRSGTRFIDTRDPKEANGLVPDKEPLFPSLDDVVMRSDREPHQYPDALGDPIPADELSEYLERSKFFVTVTSRAPETNLFNLPKIAIWPIRNSEYKTPNYERDLTTFDKLIHYCSSMGEAPGTYPRYEYIFKRENADSPTWDFEKIERNQEIYAYLEKLLESPVPGYGESFSGKYPGEYQQILTEIFDYIRTTNLHDDSIYGADFERAFVKGNTSDVPTYTNPRSERDKRRGLKGHGQVVPIQINDTKGFGRFHSLSSVNIQVISCAEPGDTPMPAHFGARQHRSFSQIPPSGLNDGTQIYLNFPPHPANFEKDKPSTIPPPSWLTALKTTNPALYEAAFKPENWNWQLAYLDGGYRDAVLGDPSANKFNRNALAPTAFTTGLTRLGSTEQLVQGMLHFSLFTPSIGWSSINPDLEIKMSIGGGFKFNTEGPNEGSFIGFDRPPVNKYVFSTNHMDTSWDSRSYGGLLAFDFVTSAPWGANSPTAQVLSNDWGQNIGSIQHGDSFGSGRLTPLDRGYANLPGYVDKWLKETGEDGDPAEVANAYRYDLVTIPFKISGAKSGGGEFEPGIVIFKGGDITFEFYHGGAKAEASAGVEGGRYGADGGELLQTVEVEVRDFTNISEPGRRAPIMYDRQPSSEPGLTGSPVEVYQRDIGGRAGDTLKLERNSFGLLERNNLGLDPGNPIGGADRKLSLKYPARWHRGNRTGAPMVGRFGQVHIHARPGLVGRGDILKSVEVEHGDLRMVAGRLNVETGELFEEHRYWDEPKWSHSLTTGAGHPFHGASIEEDYLIRTEFPGKISPYGNRKPLPMGGHTMSKDSQKYGDFDNGSGIMIDGPYINKPDEGNIHSLKGKFSGPVSAYWEERRGVSQFPYFDQEWAAESGGPAYFSPNRLVSGPGMFGSLPTGVKENIPWRTLLFRPDIKGGDGFETHPGALSPPDHVIMDLFWMPVVEPYAISEPLSTGGKININCELVPFLHIERSTAIRGVFRSEFMLCVPNAWHADYKSYAGRGRGYNWRFSPYGGALQGKRLRSAIKEKETLDQFYTKFNLGRSAFKSSSEICDIHLIPEGTASRIGKPDKGGIGTYTPTLQQMESGKYWEDHSLVGDNSRERPYTNIQNRVTTKSNTFKVHFRAQVLKQSRRNSTAEYGEWRPEMDSAVAEYRGSSIVERYVDPNSADIVDFATDPLSTLDEFYQYRVVNPRRFAP